MTLPTVLLGCVWLCSMNIRSHLVAVPFDDTIYFVLWDGFLNGVYFSTFFSNYFVSIFLICCDMTKCIFISWNE